MRHVKIASAVVVSLAAAGAVLLAGPRWAQGRPDQPAAAAPAAGAGKFAVDSVHSMVVFKISHMGLGFVYGRFNSPEGSFTIDLANPSASVLDIEVKTENVDTGSADRDKHLKNQDFFDTQKFAAITFKGKSFKKTGDKAMTVQGDLTMNGVTKSIEVPLKFIGENEKTPQGHKAGFEVNFTVKRSDYGMTKYIEGGMLGDEVNLFVNIEGKKN